MQRNTKAYILSTVAVLFWSTVATAFKLTLRYLNPYEMLFYAASTSTVIIFFIIVIRRKKVVFHKYSMLMGLLNPLLYYILLFEAYNNLLAQQALCINYLWPIVLVFVSAIFGGEKLSAKGITGLFLGFLGVVLVGTKGDFKIFAESNVKGIIYALASTIVWATYWYVNKTTKGDAEVKLFQGFLFSLPFLLLILIIKGFRLPDLRGLVGSVYIGTFEMGITFFIWLSALKIAENTQSVASLIYLSPPLSLIIIAIVLKEKLYYSTLSGLFLIIAGVWLTKREN